MPRTTLAIPTDIYLTVYDATVTQTQIDNSVVLGTPDDYDALAAFVEDAEDEFRRMANFDTRVSRQGIPDERETFEQLTYEVPGHEAFRRQWSGVGGDYMHEEVTKSLANDRIMPFDPDEGDEAYIYRGVGHDDEWEDVTDDRGDLWDVVDYRSGVVAFHPIEIDRAMIGATQGIGLSHSRLDELRFAICYRHGQSGRSRSRAASTPLGEAIDDSETGGVAVDDASDLPRGPTSDTAVYLIGREYVAATPDRDNDELVIDERGVRATNSASHESGDGVFYTPPSVRKAVAARAGMQAVQSVRYAKWLPDSDDEVDKNDMEESMRETWTKALDAFA